ncbi:MAG TPA: lytic transglycosylase domain-containing protein [Acidobacteriota bacterium]|jgi:soluble lytic murein transglycosylase-like protein
MRTVGGFVLLAVLSVILIIPDAQGSNLVVLQSGKTMKAASYSVEGETVRLIDEKSEIAIPLNWVREIRTIADPEPPSVLPQMAAVDENLDNDFQYSDLVLSLSKKHEVDWKLVAAVMKAESNFNPHAVSPKGAQGLMQLMPATARLYRVTDPYDPIQNIDAGVRHLKMLMNRFPGKLDLVLAAYNSGEKTVDHFKGIPPFSETQSYVKKVLHWMKGLSS